MSGLARRYRAIREIAAYCSMPGDLHATLERVLSTAQSALPQVSLELLLVTDDGRRLHIEPENPPSASKVGRTSLESSAAEQLVQQIPACAQSCAIALADGGSPVRAWVVPLNGSSGLSGALVCNEEALCPADKDFLDVVAQHVSLCLSAKPAPSDAETASDQAQKRVEELSAIYEISQAFDTAPIDDLLTLITEKAAVVMDAQACSLMLKDPQKDELVIKASYGLSEQVVEEARVSYGEGVAGRVAQVGEPMLIANLQGDPRFVSAKVTPRPEIVSSICVPLKDEEGQVKGVLSIHRKSPAAVFNEADVKVFSVFASQAALAISNAHLYRSLKDTVQELSTLYEASRELSGAYSVEDAARALVRVAVQMTGGVSAVVMLLDTGRGGRLQAASKITPKLRKALAGCIDADAAVWMRCLREPLSFSLDSRRPWPANMRGLADALEGSFSWVNIVPLVAEDHAIGLLILGDKHGRLPEQSRVRLLSIVASQAATVIKNASRYEEQMDEKVLEISALYKLSERISTAGNLKEAFDSILDIVRNILWYDESFISTVDYERNVMTVQACRGKKARRLQGAELSFSEDSLSSWAIRERKALLSPDINKDPRFGSASLALRGSEVRSLMAIPLIVHDEVVGVLNVYAYVPNMYSEEKVRILSVIASQAAALYKELEALSALANYTDNILRSIAAGVLTLDRDGRILTWNKAAEDVIGIPANQAAGQHFSEIVEMMGVTEADKQRILSAIRKVLETGEKYLGYKQEYHPVEGEPLYVNMNIAQLRDNAGETLGLVIIFEDVTKEIQMEAEMRRISELAAIGQLAASVAHELRNPLSSIKGAAQYLRNEYADHTAVREFLDIIVDEVNVLNKVTTEFLDFARPLKLNLRETDVNDVVFRTVQFMHLDLSRQGIQVVQNLSYDVPRIVADDKQLEQVLRNLILNAVQAMPNGGRLAVSSDLAEEGVKLIVADSGIGIPEEQIDRIFVPFFTTRTKGTGLGLSLVQKIMDNHGGKISVRSVVGQGTTFELYLPVCSDRARAAIIQAEGVAERGEADLLKRAQSS